MKVKTKCRFSKLCKYPHTEDGECDKFCSFNTREVKTNADRIRAMSDEELVEIMAHGNCGYCKIHDYCFSQKGVDCDEAWLDWLRKNATSD